MNRMLLAAGLALAFHAGLFWWGRDWVRQPAGPLPASPGKLVFELAETIAPAPVKEGVQTEPADRPLSATGAPEPPQRPVERSVPGRPDAVAPSRETPLPPPPADAVAAPSEAGPDPLITTDGAAANEAEAGEPIPAPLPEPSPAGAEKQGGEERKGQAAAPDELPAGLVAAQPLYRYNPPPAYPSAARQRQLEGIVLLEVLVNEEGKVEDLRVARSSGHSLLDRAAFQGVRHWRFEPGRRHGEPLAMWVQVPIRFTLR